jgi:PAS domain S-box-containing protein
VLSDSVAGGWGDVLFEGVGGGSRFGVDVDMAAIFASQPTAYLVMSPDLVIVEANRAYLELLGRTRAELIGRYVFDAFPPSPDALDETGGNPLQASFERARDTGLPDQMPLFHYDVEDQETGELAHRAWSLISAPVLDADGRTQLILQRVEDVSDYVAERQRLTENAREGGWAQRDVMEADLFSRSQELRAALSAQETATRRLAGMAQVALQLAATETIADLTETVAGAGLTALGADGGAIALPDADRGTVRVTMTDGLGERARRRFATLPRDSRLPAAWVARTGQPLVLGDRATGMAWSPAMAEVYEDTQRHAWIAVPLRAGDRLLGSLVAGWSEERTFSPDEVELVQAFAAQCAQALQRLEVLTAERQVAEAGRRLSETLQRSLLTEPPVFEPAEIAVRYRPARAGAGAQIGGDWYDSFLLRDGGLTLVIGDVSGHDRNAAAAMAQIRNVLRGVAQSIEEPPAAVLTQLDAALDNLRFGALATAVLAQVRQSDEQARAGTCGVRWSNAGHPPPLLVLPDGTATLLEHQPNLLLGLDPQAPRADHEVLLPPAATLLLYTDGLIESRHGSLDEGLNRLRLAAADLTGAPLDDLCDTLLDRLAPSPDDDVALLVMRVRPDPGRRPE